MNRFQQTTTSLSFLLLVIILGLQPTSAAITINATTFSSDTNAALTTSLLTGTITVGSVDGTGAITVGSSSGAQTVIIGGGAGDSTVRIASGAGANPITLGGAASTLTIGATILGASPLVFEGLTANDFKLTLAVPDVAADVTITFPDITGTVITTGNLTGITTVGTIAAGVWNGTDIAVADGGTGKSSWT